MTAPGQSQFIRLLSTLELDPEEPGDSGLVVLEGRSLEDFLLDGRPADELSHIRHALEFHAQYLYLRRCSGREATPQFYIYDYSARLEDESLAADLATLHKRLWSAGFLPLFFVFLPTQVKIFSISQGPDWHRETGLRSHPADVIHLAAQVQQMTLLAGKATGGSRDSRQPYRERGGTPAERLTEDTASAEAKLAEYAASLFDTGLFWETSRHRRKFTQAGTAFEQLLGNLQDTRAELVLDYGYVDNIVRQVLTVSKSGKSFAGAVLMRTEQ